MKFNAPNSSESKDSEKYLRLEEGKPVKGVFRGEIATKYVLWENGKPKEVNAGTPEAKVRYMANFMLLKDNHYTATVFEFGKMVYDALYAINLAYGDIEKLTVSLLKTGQKLETQYHVHPLPKEEVKDCVYAAKLHELGTKPQKGMDDYGAPPPSAHDQPWEDPDGLPF